MSKSVKWRLFAVVLILVLWMLESTPLKNKDLFSHVRAKSSKVVLKVDDAKASELDAQLADLTQEALEDNTGKKTRELRQLRKVRDKIISSEEVKAFKKAVDQAEADVKSGKTKAADSPVPMNPLGIAIVG